ncbi:MAG: RNA polymerase factor sigma-54 [Ktedonobacteraceae bacterium]
MRQEQHLVTRQEQSLRVSARLITASNILHLSSDELERAITQEQIDNPAIEVTEQRVCLICGTRLYGTTCVACGQTARQTSKVGEAFTSYENTEPQWVYQQQTFYDIDNYGFSEVDSDDDYDPLAHIPTGETLAETLLQQLEALVSPDDALIAEQLVGNLNERGYLEMSIQDIAEHVDVPIERIEYVLSQLQTLEPLGIGARTLRECLLIQLRALEEQDVPHPLTHTLIDRYLDALGHNQFSEIARDLRRPEAEIRQASMYIRTMLHPFPAHIYRDDTRYTRTVGGITYVRPDVVIRAGDDGCEIELIEEKRYGFRVETRYTDTTGSDAPGNGDVQKYMHSHGDRAKFFVDCIHRRWHTLHRVMDLVVDYQRDFLAHGVRYLHPLTRAEIATRLGLDEGTVSRATANKYALLPNGRLIPLSDFFDGSLGIKDVLREIIQSENIKHRLSDDELAHLLTARGIPIARRTVTKYREELGIGSSRERG